MARGGRRNYTRDANGRFSSTPGGGSGLGAARKKASPGARRKSAAVTGGTLAARSSLKKSRAKLAAMAKPSSAQKGAVTRASKKLAAVRTQFSKTGLKTPSNVIRKAAKKQLKQPVQKTQSNARSTAVTARTSDNNKAAAMADRQAKARRIKATVNRTGVAKGKNFNDGKDVQTLSMAEMRRAVRQRLRSTGVETKKQFKFATQQDPPKTRGAWEKLYRELIQVPKSDRNLKNRPGVINGIDIHKNFRPWVVFGLSPKTASANDVKQAYRRIAKQVHPDLGGRAKDLERVTQMRNSILALMKSSDKNKATKPKKAASTPTNSRPRGPLLLMPAKEQKRSTRRKAKG